MPSDTLILPDTIGGWRLEGPPRRIDKSNIFDYMNGAGELYLAYRLDYLLVCRYKDENSHEILVEVYVMKESRDAFGLLSLDWGGEAVCLDAPDADPAGEAIVPSSRALYGRGLLRAWSDNRYVRIMASRERSGVKEVILQLGNTITAGRNNPPVPEFLQAVKPSGYRPWTVRQDRTAYFYSHLVLNSFFYLSHENILNLGPATEAVIVTLEKIQSTQTKHSVRLLVIRYPDDEHASTARMDFFRAYLPDKKRDENIFQVEDGWMGYILAGRYLALVFECPDPDTVRDILGKTVL